MRRRARLTIVTIVAILVVMSAAVVVSRRSGDQATGAPRASTVAVEAPSRPDPGLPTEYHVAIDGADDGDGTEADPFATLERALQVASPDATIRLGEGRFHGTEIRASGLTLEGAPGHGTIVEGPLEVRASRDITIEGIVIEGVTETYGAGLSISESEGIRVVGNLVRGNSFGIHLTDVTEVLIERNEVTDNAFGIEVHHGAAGTVIRDNEIHANNRELDEVRRRGGVNFFYTTGGVTLADNRLIDNLSVGIEIFGASDLVITGNVMTGSADLIETGTGDGTPCANLTITRNVAYNSSRRDGDERGFYLRCASDSLVAHNTLDGLDKFAIGVNHEAPNFGGAVDGLRIVNNILVNGRAFSIDSELPSDVVIDHNLVWPSAGARHGSQVAFYEPVGRGTADASQFRAWSGYQEHGVTAEPGFVSRNDRDYRLEATSAAIDAGVSLSLPGDVVIHAKPDLGRFEHRP
jgi:parallel beta-helix repeat protein